MGVGQRLGVEAGASQPAHRHPLGGRQGKDVLQHGGGLEALGHQQLVHPPPAGGQQLLHRPAALDLLAAQAPLGPVTAPRRRRGAAAPGSRPLARAAGHQACSRPEEAGGPADSSRATAQHATPSPRPRAPTPSARLGLTATGAPTTADRRSSMAGRWGASRGASRATTQSTLTAPQPSSRTRATARASRSMLSAPAHRGSPSGNREPRSGAPAAPRRASATAWATASASLWPARPGPPSISTPPSRRARPGSLEKGWTSKPSPTRIIRPPPAGPGPAPDPRGG